MRMRAFSSLVIFVVSFTGLVASAPRDYVEAPTLPLSQSSQASVLSYPSSLLLLNDYPLPASNFEQKGFFLGGFYGGDFYGGYVPVFLTGSYGNLVFTPFWLHSDQEEGLQEMVSLPIFIARQVAPALSIGFTLRPSYFQVDQKSVFGIGVDPSLGIKIPWGTGEKNGFVFRDAGIILETRNLSVYSSDNEDLPRIQLLAGYGMTFYQWNLWQLSLHSQVYGVGDFTTLPWSTSMRVQYGILGLSGGYIQTQENSVHTNLIAGADLAWNHSRGTLLASYSFMPALGESDTSPVHNVTLGYAFGQLDTEPPEVEFQPGRSHFSPNSDGKADYVIFETRVRDKSPLKNWKLEIIDVNGKTVRVFESDERLIRQKFSMSGAAKSFFVSRESLVVPGRIRWDGTGKWKKLDELADAGDETLYLPDGVYSYSFTVEDVKGNKSAPVTGQVVLDTSVPDVRLAMEQKLFSPNGDGNFDEMTIDQEFFLSDDDVIHADVVNEAGEKVRSYKWNRDSAPAVFRWDGTLADGSPASGGLYTYSISVEDAAENKRQKKSSAFLLSRDEDSVDLRLNRGGFSIGKATITMEPLIARRNGIVAWDLFISRSIPDPDKMKANMIQEWKGVDIQSLPAAIEWDGKDINGTVQKDGIYYAVLQVDYENGNRPVSRPHKIVIDSTEPEVAVESDLRLFSPDNDGENDEQTFRLQIQDESALSEYKLMIYEIQYDEKNRKTRIPFKTFTGSGSYSEKIFWDGKGDSGRLVESATRYEYELIARDEFDNEAKSATGRFDVDILVLQTDRGLKIRLSNIQFQTGSAKINKDGEKLLDKLVEKLRRYPDYRIHIEGHTDSEGPEEVNLRLSEKRALSVLHYLESKGIEKKRLSYQGMGEIYPLLPNDSWYNKSRNRRVEFFLLRD